MSMAAVCSSTKMDVFRHKAYRGPGAARGAACVCECLKLRTHYTCFASFQRVVRARRDRCLFHSLLFFSIQVQSLSFDFLC